MSVQCHPAGPTGIEYLRRVGLKQHAVKHGIAAQADALKGERRLGELVPGAQWHERHLRVFARHVENRKVGPVSRQPYWEVGAADCGRGRAARFDNQDALAPAARHLQFGGDDCSRAAAAHDDRIVTAGSRNDALSAAARTAEQSAQLCSDTDCQTGLPRTRGG